MGWTQMTGGGSTATQEMKKHDVFTEARIGGELELLRKPSPLGDERGEFEGGWAHDLNGRNPAFPRAIPHGMVVFHQLLKVVFFGSSWGSRNGLIWGPEMVPFGDPK